MNDNKPLVSIVICTCNRQNLLENAIEAALNQSYTNKEIICVLGMNSTDMSEEMLTQLRAKDMIKFIKNYGNRIDARNKGFDFAKGKYVCFLDDDDSMLSNRLEKQVDFLENNPHVGVVSCSTMLNDKAGLMHTFKGMDSAEIDRLLFEGNDIDEIVNFQSCMFRKEEIDRAFGKEPKFDKLFIAGGEGQFFLYNCMFNKNITFANIPTTIYIYYVGQAKNSLSNCVDPVFYNEHLYGKSYNDKFEFVRNFRNNYPLSEAAIAEKPITILPEEIDEITRRQESPVPTETKKEEQPEVVVEKPKRGRKKKTEEVKTNTEEAPKPKRTRKKKVTAEEPEATSVTMTFPDKVEVVVEKPKRGRKKKVTTEEN